MTELPGSTIPPLASHVRDRELQHHGSLEHEHGGPMPLNVGETERWFSVIGGAALTVLGLSRRTLGGLGLAAIGGALMHRGLTGHCRAYHALGIDTTEPRGPENSVRAQHGVKVEETVVIFRPREDLYRFWRDFSNLPKIMCFLQSVQTQPGGRSRWIAKGPMDVPVEWEAEVITDRPDELIGWRSVGDSQIDTAGSVRFLPTPDGRGTEVRVALKYDPPAGKLGDAVAGLLGRSPAQEIRQDLRRFKSLMESQVVAGTGGQPTTRTGDGHGPAL
jgi:uncharacterized membrane protein